MHYYKLLIGHTLSGSYWYPSFIVQCYVVLTQLMREKLVCRKEWLHRLCMTLRDGRR